jgi:hypothetical protein
MDGPGLSLEDRARAYAALLCLESGAHLTEDQCGAMERAGLVDGEEPFSTDFLQSCDDIPEVVRVAADYLPASLDTPEECWSCKGSGVDGQWERNPCRHCDGDGYIL